MKQTFFSTLIFALALLSASNLSAQRYTWRDTTISIEKRIDDIVSNLSLEEKISLLQHRNPAIERLGLKPYSWWNEALHGVARNGKATVYPMPIAMAASWDYVLVEDVFRSIAVEARNKFAHERQLGNYGDYQGLTFFTPNINILRDPRWGRGMETFGEDPWLTARMGLAAVNGLQTRIGRNRILSAACLKHLAVHRGPEASRHRFNSRVSTHDLFTTYLPAFEYIIKNSNVQQVMCAYNRLNGEPCCTNNELLQDILRKQWRYDGIVVTDCWALNDCWERDKKTPRHETHADAKAASAAAFGGEVDLECGSGLAALKEAVDSGLISRETIDRHLRRVLRTRLTVGVDYPLESVRLPKAAPRPLDMARESIVMLKNNGALPICLPGIEQRHFKQEVRHDIHRLAIVGPNIDDVAMMLGNYNGDPINPVTPLDAFTRYATSIGKEQLELFSEPLNDLVEEPDYLEEQQMNICIDHLANYDAIIYIGGLSPKLEGEELEIEREGFSRGDRSFIELPTVQANAIKAIKVRTGKPVIAVFCTGSALALGEIEDYADAILVAFYGGEAMGQALFEAIADASDGALFGRLPMTFYASTLQLPPFDNYSMRGRTYRYFEGTPSYPFGFGLTYNGAHSLRSIKYNPKTRSVTGILRVEGHPHEEVVQVYLKGDNTPGSFTKTLVGFERTEERQSKASDVPFSGLFYRHDVMFSIPVNYEAFRSYDEATGKMRLPAPGTKFKLLVGFSSDDKDLTEIEMTY